MIRSFIALPIPAPVADALDDIQTGLDAAHWVPEENLHLTLAFLGDQTRPALEDLDAALRAIRMSSFSLALKGVGAFGGGEPRTLFAGVAPAPELERLQAKTANAARALEMAIDERRFTPHVTIARFGRRQLSAEAAQSYIAAHSLFESPRFEIDAFALYRSELSRAGPTYSVMAEYPLSG